MKTLKEDETLYLVVIVHKDKKGYKYYILKYLS